MMLILVWGCSNRTPGAAGPGPGETWKALHVLNYNTDTDLAGLAQMVPDLAQAGINVLILEVDYHFAFVSHPELRQGDDCITPAGARSFASECEKNSILLIPQFQCLGHQSWAEETFPLLTEYPEFDMTPGAYPDNKDIYCREWNPMNPRVHKIVLELIDEIIDAFNARAFHVGMDEVFLINDEHSVIKDSNPAEVFARVVNDLYAHIKKVRNVDMLMWGDRLIDGRTIDYGLWESSENGTARAVDMISSDIIICDWHYEPRDTYESVPVFIHKGFRVLPASFINLEACQDLIAYSFAQDDSLMLGHMFTTWSRRDTLTAYKPMVQGLALMNELERAVK